MKLFLLKFIVFYFGCLSCYLLQVHFLLHPVVATATVGFLGSFLHFPRLYEKKGLHAAIYAGCFAGMCSRSVIEGPEQVVMISFIGALLYVLCKPYANGFGGKLGLISFVSSLLFFLSKGLL